MYKHGQGKIWKQKLWVRENEEGRKVSEPMVEDVDSND